MLEILLYLSQMIEQVITGEVARTRMNDEYSDLIEEAFPSNSSLSLIQLPADILCYLAVFLQPKDIVSLGQTCRTIHTLFKSDSRSVYSANRLLTDVMQGRQDKVEKFLSSCPLPLTQRLLQTKMNFISAGIPFNSVTAFQYALWARDWHMYTMLNHFLSPSNAKQQLLEWDRRELELGHYSLTPLIDAYSTLLAFFNIRDYTGYLGESSERINQFDALLNAVGVLQQLAPAHIIQQYFHAKGSWETTPKFEQRNHLIRCDLAAHSAGIARLGDGCVLTRGVYEQAYFTGKKVHMITRFLFAEFHDDLRIANFIFYNAPYDHHALMALSKAASMKYDEFKASLFFAPSSSNINHSSNRAYTTSAVTLPDASKTFSSADVTSSMSSADVTSSMSSVDEPEESDARRAARPHSSI